MSDRVANDVGSTIAPSPPEMLDRSLLSCATSSFVQSSSLPSSARPQPDPGERLGERPGLDEHEAGEDGWRLDCLKVLVEIHLVGLRRGARGKRDLDRVGRMDLDRPPHVELALQGDPCAQVKPGRHPRSPRSRRSMPGSRHEWSRQRTHRGVGTSCSVLEPRRRVAGKVDRSAGGRSRAVRAAPGRRDRPRTVGLSRAARPSWSPRARPGCRASGGRRSLGGGGRCRASWGGQGRWRR